MRPQRVTVWCVFWSQGVIGPFFIENDETVNAERYRHMLRMFFLDNVDQLGMDNLWFQQDGASYHTARAPMELLNEEFRNRVISRKGLITWPARSGDLTSLDYFLWGYGRYGVYVT